MNNRLNELIEYQTNGRRGEFAERLGWSAPYLSKLLRGEGLGIAPVRTILSVFPDVSARWLLLGEGDMISEK